MNSNKHTRRIAHAGKSLVTLAVIVASLIILSSVAFIRNQGETYQEQLEVLYEQSLSSFSTCIEREANKARVDGGEFDGPSDQLLLLASYQYVNKSDKSSIPPEEVLGSESFITMIQEQHPQLDQRSQQDLQAVVIDCRSKHQPELRRAFDHAQQFSSWTDQGGVFGFVRWEFPSDDLSIKDLGHSEVLTGADALTRVTDVYLVGDLNQAFVEGRL